MKIILSADHKGAWPKGVERTYPHILLIRDNWNDYGFETLFGARLYEAEGAVKDLGAVKIAFFGNQAGHPVCDALQPEQDKLDASFFSLGQQLDFYERLAELPDLLRADYASSMRDIPLLQIARHDLALEPVFETSFLRNSRAREALDKAPLLFGRSMHEVTSFEFTTQLRGASAPHSIKFDFTPDRGLPHRINVLVGVNGVGKTQLMARLAILLTSFERKDQRERRTAKGGNLREIGMLSPLPSFYGVIAVSFSAFDDFELPDLKEADDFHYAYCGLRRREGGNVNEDDLSARIPALMRAMDGDRRALAVDAVGKALHSRVDEKMLVDADYHRSLSAGQRIIINIILSLSLNLQSRSLVLLDEPETHLHPQLVSRLLSVLNDLLEGFDSAAVIATHSPIVVQQALARRVHVIRRLDGDLPFVETAQIETFGENLSDIVRIVFDAPEIDRGYQEVLARLLSEHDNVEAVEELFDGRLGFNAQIYLRSREHKS